MSSRPLLRDLAMLALAAAIGWWARGSSPAVHAAASAAPDPGLSFQMGMMGRETGLTVYSPATHTLYVYPAVLNSSEINCAYSFSIGKPGESISRNNCPIGSTGH
jgi:hypothetical protein